MLALWYLYDPVGQQFLLAREQRALLAGAGLLIAYLLLRTRKRVPRISSRWRVFGRMILAAILSAGLWWTVDLLRGEDWIHLLLNSESTFEYKPQYLILIGAGWLGWAIVFFEVMRRLVIARRPPIESTTQKE